MYITITYTITFFAVLPFVAGVADAGSHDAGPAVAACDVDALVGGDVALGALPAAVTHAATFKVLAIPAAEHRAGGCEDSRRGNNGEAWQWVLCPKCYKLPSTCIINMHQFVSQNLTKPNNYWRRNQNNTVFKFAANDGWQMAACVQIYW